MRHLRLLLQRLHHLRRIDHAVANRVINLIKHTFADRLGQHIAQRFSGMPAISLAPEEHKD